MGATESPKTHWRTRLISLLKFPGDASFGPAARQAYCKAGPRSIHDADAHRRRPSWDCAKLEFGDYSP